MQDIVDQGPQAEPPANLTPDAVRRALQELLKYGWVEQAAKPHLFQTILTQTATLNGILEPLDLQARVDDIRGLAWVCVPPDYQTENADDDEWTHPLVRRQRLTLEHSLLVAILRREFVSQEQTSGIGVTVRVALEDLLPQVQVYLGDPGSDAQERKRLLGLLENLRGHGIVSEVDMQDYVTIRPMIVHLANPENLQALLLHLRTVAGQQATAPEPPQSGNED